MSGSGESPNSGGERILAASRRPDGTLRKPVRIRAGYTPQDEVAVYQSKGSQIRLSEAGQGSSSTASLTPKLDKGSKLNPGAKAMGVLEDFRNFSHRKHRSIISAPVSRRFPLSLVLNTLQDLTMRLVEVNSLHWSQKRGVSSTREYSFPRESDEFGSRYREYLSKPYDPANSRLFKIRQRLPESERLPEPEYKAKIIENSTKAMALVPKKWKRALPCKEVVDTVTFLRKAKRNPDAVKQVLRKRVSRLLKLEMMLVLSELQHLDEWILALQVFNMIRKENWYRPNVYLYQTMVQLFGRCKQIKEVENMLKELEREGLRPDDSIKRELLRAYTLCSMIPEAVQVYKGIQEEVRDRAARTILFHCLKPEEKQELAIYEQEKGYDWTENS